MAVRGRSRASAVTGLSIGLFFVAGPLSLFSMTMEGRQARLTAGQVMMTTVAGAGARRRAPDESGHGDYAPSGRSPTSAPEPSGRERARGTASTEDAEPEEELPPDALCDEFVALLFDARVISAGRFGSTHARCMRKVRRRSGATFAGCLRTLAASPDEWAVCYSLYKR